MYILLNKNLLLQKIYKSSSLSNCFHELLCNVELELDTLIKYNSKINNLNVKNFIIYKINKKKKAYTQILQEYHLNNTFDELIEIDSNNKIHFNNDMIKKKVKILQTKVSLINKNIKIVNSVRMEPTPQSSVVCENYIGELKKITPTTINKTENKLDIVNLKEIESTIKELEQKKNYEKENLLNLKLQKKEFSNNISNEIDQLNCEKRNLFKQKEIREERKRILESDINTFYLIQNDINNGKIKYEDISEIFIDKYNILCVLEEDDLLKEVTDELYETYWNLVDSVEIKSGILGKKKKLKNMMKHDWLNKKNESVVEPNFGLKFESSESDTDMSSSIQDSESELEPDSDSEFESKTEQESKQESKSQLESELETESNSELKSDSEESNMSVKSQHSDLNYIKKSQKLELEEENNDKQNIKFDIYINGASRKEE